MKKVILLDLHMALCLVSCLMPISFSFAQAPQGLNYQAIVRNASGDILSDQTIGIQFTITDGNDGPVVYQETHSAITNQFGLLTLTIGHGTVMVGDFSSILWSGLSPWLQVEMDENGGTNFKIMGTSPLQSVPYALFAAKSGGESAWDTSGANIFFNHYVGIGTDEPSAPLTIQTGINEVGFSHTNTENPIELSTYISDTGASIGTMSDHPLSLNAGGTGKVHILPDGRVVLGDDSDPSNIAGSHQIRSTPLLAKLYLETPINSTGWLHVGGPDSIIVSEGIGGVSAALGTVTNHIFRLNSGGQGRLHLWPDGKVVVGASADSPYSKFTVHTPNNSDGISHVSDGGVILKTFVGGISAVIGTASNHTMRISANNVAVINIEPNGDVGIGTTNPAGYKLAVNGNVRAKEIVVETGWADYVFDQKYKLSSLRELENFIRENHHLPNVPSAKMIEENGLHVGEVQKIMMEKIEELTLHIIELNKRIETLENHNRS